MQETQVQSLSRDDLLEKEMATHSSILAWEIPWTEEPGGLQSMRSQKSQTWLSNWKTTTNWCLWDHFPLRESEMRSRRSSRMNAGLEVESLASNCPLHILQVMKVFDISGAIFPAEIPTINSTAWGVNELKASDQGFGNKLSANVRHCYRQNDHRSPDHYS